MSRKRAAQPVQETEQIPELNISAEELARMHPLVRMAIDFVSRDRVETTTRFDCLGNVVSVQRKVQRSANSARTLHSLLNAIRPLIKLEQEWLARQPRYDLEGTVADGGNGTPISPPFELLSADCLSVMGYGKPASGSRDANSNLDGSSDTPPLPPRDASPDLAARFNYYHPPGER